MDSAQSNDLAAKADPFIRVIEEIDFDLVTEKRAYMDRCRRLRAQRKDVFGAAKDDGIAVAPLKAIVKRRNLERKIAALPMDFGMDESAQYNALASAFAGTPFGDFAAARARAAAEDGARPDEEHLAALRARLTGIGLDPIDGFAGR
jgi:hypothetical protein